MSMVLRSRRRTGLPPGEAGSHPRRSVRLRGNVSSAPLVEETDDSDSEAVMESQESIVSQSEEEAADGTHAMSLRSCSVMLEHDIRTEEEAARKDLEEKEDMSRKSGRAPVSRIPTFQSTLTKKRPTSGSQNTELPLSKKDAFDHAAQPLEKSDDGSVEVSKTKLPGIRETALPLPSVRLVPKVGLETLSPIGLKEQAVTSANISLTSPLKNCGLTEESVDHPFMTVSSRPALRAELGDQASENKVDVIPDDPIAGLSPEGFLDQTRLEEAEEECEAEVDSGNCLAASGDAERPESEEVIEEDRENLCQVKDIVDEEPPWKTEQMKFDDVLKEGDELSSDAPCVQDPVVEKSDVSSVSESEEVNSHHDQYAGQGGVPSKSLSAEERTDPYKSTTPAGPQKPPKVGSSQPTKRPVCSSFGLFCLLPTTLLLLGGFGQHVWRYGLPMSVAHLVVQLELHWLDGLGLVQEPCSSDCRVRLVESVPVGLYPSAPSPLPSISDSWLHLLNNANSSVRIAAFYFTLRDMDTGLAEPSDSEGRKVFEQLMQLESKGVQLQIAVNAPQTSTQDTAELAATGAEVREVDLQSVTGGIVHTKLWVVDEKHLYLGSANMDWRSLSQVKEVGLSVEDCSCLAQDASRIFGVYWNIGAEKNGSLPLYWPARLSALSSSQQPLRLKLNGVPADVYLSSAPPQLSARGRTDDLSSILSVIADAQKFIHISVMDYLPLSQYTEPLRFWPAIDTALRAAACTRGVEVKLLVSCWQHSSASMFIFLQSLLVLNRPPLGCDINVKVFVVPLLEENIPYARVNHAKYMVTDRVVYIGTSNWSENYFTHTAGVGLVVNQTASVVDEDQATLQSQLDELFLRDWASQYASTLSADDVDVCPHHHHHHHR